MVGKMTAVPGQQGGGSLRDRVKPGSARVAIVAIFFAVVTGGLAALVTMPLGQSRWAFPIVAAISGGYLWKTRLATDAIGTGFHITAILLVLTPILLAIPTVLGVPADPGAPMRITSILGFLIWGILFPLVALVVAALGYSFKDRAVVRELNRGKFPP